MPIHQVIKRATEFRYLTAPKTTHIPDIPLYIKWQPPNSHHYQLNTDGAARSQGCNGIGGVIRNQQGK